MDHSDATHDKLLRFNRLWVTEFAPDSLLVFSTGRSPLLFHELAVRPALAERVPPHSLVIAPCYAMLALPGLAAASEPASQGCVALQPPPLCIAAHFQGYPLHYCPLLPVVQGEVPLLTPDILVCSVGTEILISGKQTDSYRAGLHSLGRLAVAGGGVGSFNGFLKWRWPVHHAAAGTTTAAAAAMTAALAIAAPHTPAA